MGVDRVSDPIEKIVASALDKRGLQYLCDGDGETYGLDFRLPDPDLCIEVKQFHSDRISEQMARTKNVIAIQGVEAAQWFARQISTPGRDDLIQIVAEALERRYGTLASSDDGIASDILAIAETAVSAMLGEA